jgi:hypothetical protein
MASLLRAASSAGNQTRAQLRQESCGTVWQVLDSIQTLLSPMLFPKTQNLSESDKVNMVVSTIHHPMYLITGLIIEVV